MGKAEKGTPKYIANKMKAKGLQKLRWYCQMCQKQCRDENGFKCHTMSESHQRQLLLFADNSRKYLGGFSREFSQGYLEILKRQFGTKRVNANKVYQEYITDKQHIHMNSTQWETLTGFVKWLGREGKCVVDETEKGWYVTYIDRDPSTIAAQEAANKKGKMDKDDQERMMDFIDKQIKRGQVEVPEPAEKVYKELQRKDDEEKITVCLKTKALAPKPILPVTSKILDKRKIDNDDTRSTTSSKKYKSTERKMSALDEIRMEEERRKKRYPPKFREQTPRTEKTPAREKTPERAKSWLHENIIVKVITKSLGDKYYKQKGIIKKVVDSYGAEIKMLETGDKLKLDQDHLETVIPGIGRNVLIVDGSYKGKIGKLLCLTDDDACKVEINEMQKRFEYNQICKVQIDS